jgi:hypothetical protein
MIIYFSKCNSYQFIGSLDEAQWNPVSSPAFPDCYKRKSFPEIA